MPAYSIMHHLDVVNVERRFHACLFYYAPFGCGECREGVSCLPILLCTISMW